jgi:electron transport complex protein RnfG
MRETVRYGIILAVICLMAGGLLAGVNTLTKGRISAQLHAEEDVGLKEVMPQAEQFIPVKQQENILYYKAVDKGGKLVGAVFKAQGKGYSSTIETMVGMFKDGTICAIKILDQNETPGLGANVAGPDFTGQFKNKKDLTDVQAITGATISSKAVMDSVAKKAEEIRALIKDFD